MIISPTFLTIHFMIKLSWHTISPEETLKTLKVDKSLGLTEEEAEKRRSVYGLNVIREEKRKSPFLLFLSQFNDILVWILIIAALLSGIVLKELIDAIAISSILFLNALLGFFQELKAERALEALKKLAAPKAKVLREGKEILLDSSLLVPGDILLLEAGDVIAADARLIESFSLSIDESLLTGESEPVGKNPLALKKEIVPLGDMKPLVFAGTVVVRGNGKAVVVATGKDTQMGGIASLIQEEKEKTPLQIEIKKLGAKLGGICIGIASLVFPLGFLRKFQPVEMFLTSVSLAVAAIPEGLPAAITVSLALGVQRMAKRNAIVRRLHAVETLGSTTFICTDKTGTLTLNEMTVRKIFLKDLLKEPEELKEFLTDPQYHFLILTSLLCNEVREREGKLVGDPTEIALVKLAEKQGYKKEKVLKKYPLVNLFPFDSERKMMTTVHKSNDEFFTLSKGALESISAHCRKVPKTAFKTAEDLAMKGYRVLALAYKKTNQPPASQEDAENDLFFLGLLALSDPPRPEVPQALKKCQEAGIKVSMITGDHRLTAESIATEIGLLNGGLVLSGEDLQKIPEDEFEKLVEKIRVYARVDPKDKLRIVKALKGKGHITAMTGDGINDAPAIKLADIGIAMGETGTDVTKEAAEMVLADDNFATIVAAVEEGRLIFNNIKKFVHFLISCNISEVGTIFLSILLGLPLPLYPIQILWINLITDGAPALALGVDPPDPGLMERPPRKRDEGVLTPEGLGKIVKQGLVLTFFALLSFFISFKMGFSPEEGRTILFSTLVLSQLIHAYLFRIGKSDLREAFKNKYLNFSFFISLSLQLIITYTFISPFFHAYPLPLNAWLLPFLASVGAFLVNFTFFPYKEKGS